MSRESEAECNSSPGVVGACARRGLGCADGGPARRLRAESRADAGVGQVLHGKAGPQRGKHSAQERLAGERQPRRGPFPARQHPRQAGRRRRCGEGAAARPRSRLSAGADRALAGPGLARGRRVRHLVEGLCRDSRRGTPRPGRDPRRARRREPGEARRRQGARGLSRCTRQRSRSGRGAHRSRPHPHHQGRPQGRRRRGARGDQAQPGERRGARDAGRPADDAQRAGAVPAVPARGHPTGAARGQLPLRARVATAAPGQCGGGREGPAGDAGGGRVASVHALPQGLDGLPGQPPGRGARRPAAGAQGCAAVPAGGTARRHGAGAAQRAHAGTQPSRARAPARTA